MWCSILVGIGLWSTNLPHNIVNCNHVISPTDLRPISGKLLVKPHHLHSFAHHTWLGPFCQRGLSKVGPFVTGGRRTLGAHRRIAGSGFVSLSRRTPGAQQRIAENGLASLKVEISLTHRLGRELLSSRLSDSQGSDIRNKASTTHWLRRGRRRGISRSHLLNAMSTSVSDILVVGISGVSSSLPAP